MQLLALYKPGKITEQSWFPLCQLRDDERLDLDGPCSLDEVVQLPQRGVTREAFQVLKKIEMGENC